MSPPVRSAALRATVAVLLASALLAPASPTRAADVTIGKPAAESTYLQGITFEATVTTGAPLSRAEIWLRLPGSIGPSINSVPVTTALEQTLTYELDLANEGHLVPNTPIEATWAVFSEPDSEPVFSEPVSVHYADTSQEWQTLKGEIVVVHWYQGDAEFARRALDIGERAIRETAAFLQVEETDPVDFYIYADETPFRAALGPDTRENVGGQAHAAIRTLFALITPDQISDTWVGVVIPHELVHLVFDTAVKNPYRFPPRWFNEGLAVYLSEGYTPSDRALVEDAVASGDLNPLPALSGQFPADSPGTYLAYAESASAIDHIVRKHGEAGLLGVIAAYREGLTDANAFTQGLGVDFETMQTEWYEELGARTPTQFGPVPNPSGPLPDGWGAERPSPAATAKPGQSPAGEAPVEPRTASGGSDMLLVVLALAVVVLVVIVGMVVARRRSAVP